VQKFNYHTHTYRCGHADYNMTDEDYVINFINAGFNKIAFTDHAPQKEVIDKRSNMRMKYSEIDNYLNSIKYLKEKYKDKIEIQSGFEIEYLPGQEENLYELKNLTDKLVLGQHFIYNIDESDLLIFRYHDFTDEELLKYANYIEKSMELSIADIIVHPDIYMLGRNNFGEIEKKVAHIICKSAEKYNIPLEINLTEPNLYLIKYKDKVEYPSKGFWEIASEYNIKVIYGVDAHYKDQISNFEECINVANNIIGKDTILKLNFCEDL